MADAKIMDAPKMSPQLKYYYKNREAILKKTAERSRERYANEEEYRARVIAKSMRRYRKLTAAKAELEAAKAQLEQAEAALMALKIQGQLTSEPTL